jgi:hypothetical protein
MQLTATKAMRRSIQKDVTGIMPNSMPIEPEMIP